MCTLKTTFYFLVTYIIIELKAYHDAAYLLLNFICCTLCTCSPSFLWRLLRFRLWYENRSYNYGTMNFIIAENPCLTKDENNITLLKNLTKSPYKFNTSTTYPLPHPHSLPTIILLISPPPCIYNKQVLIVPSSPWPSKVCFRTNKIVQFTSAPRFCEKSEHKLVQNRI